jgi:hypothetical protein
VVHPFNLKVLTQWQVWHQWLPRLHTTRCCCFPLQYCESHAIFLWMLWRIKEKYISLLQQQ